MRKVIVRFNKSITSIFHDGGERYGKGTYTLIEPTVSIIMSDLNNFTTALINKPWPHSYSGNATRLCFSSDILRDIIKNIDNRSILMAILEDYFSYIKYYYVRDKLDSNIHSHISSDDYFICKHSKKIFKNNRNLYGLGINDSLKHKIPMNAVKFESLKGCYFCGFYNFRFLKTCSKCNHEFPK